MIKYFLFIITIITGSDTLRDQYKNVSDKAIKEILGAGDLEKIEIEPAREYYRFVSENEKNGSVVVYSSAKGRYENFDFMVILNNKAEILNIRILKYRSEYGYEISNKGLLKQFYNKPVQNFGYGKDIDVISGASFSARALVDDVNHILGFLQK